MPSGWPFLRSLSWSWEYARKPKRLRKQSAHTANRKVEDSFRTINLQSFNSAFGQWRSHSGNLIKSRTGVWHSVAAHSVVNVNVICTTSQAFPSISRKLEVSKACGSRLSQTSHSALRDCTGTIRL